MGYRNLTAIVEVDGVIPAPNSSVQENTSNYDGLIEFREKRSTKRQFQSRQWVQQRDWLFSVKGRNLTNPICLLRKFITDPKSGSKLSIPRFTLFEHKTHFRRRCFTNFYKIDPYRNTPNSFRSAQVVIRVILEAPPRLFIPNTFSVLAGAFTLFNLGILLVAFRASIFRQISILC